MDNTKKGMDIAPPCGCYIYIFSYGENTMGKGYRFMGLLSKMSEWMDGWIPVRLLRVLEHLRC